MIRSYKLQGQSHISKLAKIEMLLKLLFCILIPITRGNPSEGLISMYNDWDESMLFIYYEPEVNFDWHFSTKFQNPNCFAFQLSSTYAFTTSSCFMNLEEISKMVINRETHESIMERILSGNDIKSNIDKFVVVQVIFGLFPDLFLNMTNKYC